MSGNEDHHRQGRRFAARGNGHDGRDPRDVEIERLRQRVVVEEKEHGVECLIRMIITSSTVMTPNHSREQTCPENGFGDHRKDYGREATVQLSERTLAEPKEFKVVIEEIDTSERKTKVQGTGNALLVTLIDEKAHTSINAIMLKAEYLTVVVVVYARLGGCYRSLGLERLDHGSTEL
nr:ribonuclease TUDOR 1-like [Tanacetum cinerariifolium]